MYTPWQKRRVAKTFLDGFTTSKRVKPTSGVPKIIATVAQQKVTRRPTKASQKQTQQRQAGRRRRSFVRQRFPAQCCPQCDRFFPATVVRKLVWGSRFPRF